MFDYATCVMYAVVFDEMCDVDTSVMGRVGVTECRLLGTCSGDVQLYVF